MPAVKTHTSSKAELYPKREVYLGIDPGISGGIAAIYPGEVLASPMIENEQDLFKYLLTFKRMPCFCILEKVWGHVGGEGKPGAYMFTFGQNYGSVRMALVAAGIPFEAVAPVSWQRSMRISPRKSKGVGRETRPQFKRRLREEAQRLFPSLNVTLGTSDALLLAEYCRRKRNGVLNDN